MTLYVLERHFGRRGFCLLRNLSCVFETKHWLGLFPNSSVALNGDTIDIKIMNFVGDKCQIYKNGDKIGTLNFYHYLYAVISLNRNDGGHDHFKLEQEGYSNIHALSQNGEELLKFKANLNPLRIGKRFEVEQLKNDFPQSAIEELIFYVGEILYRKAIPDSLPF